MELISIPKDFDEYINTEINLGKRLGKCTIGMINQFSTPVLYIKSKKKPFFGLVSMISGGYYYFDKLDEKESEKLNKYMHTFPNFHGGNFTNWTFIFIQYLVDQYNQTGETNREILFINSNLDKSNDLNIVPDFSKAYQYQKIEDIDDFIDKIVNILEENKK